jgi:hypothetical protein
MWADWFAIHPEHQFPPGGQSPRSGQTSNTSISLPATDPERQSPQSGEGKATSTCSQAPTTAPSARPGGSPAAAGYPGSQSTPSTSSGAGTEEELERRRTGGTKVDAIRRGFGDRKACKSRVYALKGRRHSFAVDERHAQVPAPPDHTQCAREGSSVSQFRQKTTAPCFRRRHSPS